MTTHIIDAMNDRTAHFEIFSKSCYKDTQDHICNEIAVALELANFRNQFKQKHFNILLKFAKNLQYLDIIYYWFIIRDEYIAEWEELGKPETYEQWIINMHEKGK